MSILKMCKPACASVHRVVDSHIYNTIELESVMYCNCKCFDGRADDLDQIRSYDLEKGWHTITGLSI